MTLKRLRNFLSRRLLQLFLISGFCVGCRAAPKLGATHEGTPRYRRASLVYALDAGQRPLPLRTSEITPVVYGGNSHADEHSTGNWATATLSIHYPHPDGDDSKARAVLRLSTQQSRPTCKQPEGECFTTPDDEVWILDIQKQELDVLLTDLAGSGFFQRETRQSVGTHLDVRLDWGRTQKTWTPEPRLDQFISRVYSEGKLGGLVPCAAFKN